MRSREAERTKKTRGRAEHDAVDAPTLNSPDGREKRNATFRPSTQPKRDDFT